MGAEKSTITALTLNYSGIYLSPFQYYAIDNWQELQKVGRIFQEELKRCYLEIKQKTQQLGGKPFTEKQYKRKSFEWMVGDIDKDIHTTRYTPVYTNTEKIKNRDFAGIGRNNNKQFFLNQQEFQHRWHQVFDELAKTNENAQKASPLHRYNCFMFDFLCFKSIVLFVNHQDQNADKIFDFKEVRYWDFSKVADQSKQYNMSKIVDSYKEFMADYYSRIHIGAKIQLTIKWMFQKNKPETVSFTQATPQFRKALQNISGYHLFGPSNPNKVKQTIIMVKASLPFIPPNFDAKNQRLKKNDMRVQKEDIFAKSGSNIDLLATDLEHFIKNNFKGNAKDFLLNMNRQLRQNPQTMKKRIDSTIDSYIDNPIKTELQMQLKEYIDSFEQFYQTRLKKQYKEGSKQEKKASEWIGDLKKKNFLFWTQDIIFKAFPDSKEKVILGAFHLSSKTQIGQLEGQLMGLIIYHLAQIKGYKFIFSGDFNSYITLSDKDENLCVFQFLKFLKFPPQKLKHLFDTVNIYPKHPKILTTKKKRTILQVQTRKVNELAEKCIDQICSNFKIDYNSSHSGEIKDIGQSLNNYSSFLPHKEHPYDHFVVEATLNFKQPQQ